MTGARLGLAYLAMALALYVSSVNVEALGVVGGYSKTLSVVFIVLIGGYYALKKSTWAEWAMDRFGLLLVAGLLVFGFVSLAWTVDTGATFTALAAWVYTLFLAFTLVGLGVAHACRVVLFVFALFCALGVVSALVGHEAFALNHGVQRFQGLFYGPHALARPATICLIILASGAAKLSLRLNAALWLIIGLSLFLTFSRQAYLGVAIGVAVTLFFRGTGTIRGHVILVGALVAVGLVAFAELNGFSVLSALSRGEGDDVASLTGRTFIWQAAVELIKLQPWGGYGFGAGGSALEEYYSAGAYGWRTYNVHNGYLQALLDGGMVGFLVFFGALLYGLKKGMQGRDPLVLGLYTSLLTITFVERGVYGLGGLVVTVFVLIVAGNLRVDRSSEQSRF